jgi:ABC-type phosphate transport system substrate-binding protein
MSMLSAYSDPQVTIGVITLVVTILLSAAAVWIKRKRISYRVHMDTEIGLKPDHGNDMVEMVLKNRGIPVDEPSFALVRIMNTGSAAIRANDFEAPLRLDFAGRRVVDVKVIEADRVLLRMLDEDESWPPVGNTMLVLPKVPLNRKHRIKLLVLLSGKPDPDIKPPVTCEGFVSGGRISRDTTTGNGPSRRTLVLGGLALVLVSASVASVISVISTQRSSGCASGNLVIEGSSAFAPVATAVADVYRKTCGDDAKIDVRGTGTYAGLDALNAAAKTNSVERDTRIAMTDGPAVGASYAGLVPHPVGVVTFAVVVNKKTGVTNLTTEQLQNIYSGRTRDWKGDGTQPIRIVSRGAQSGTRAAFESKVLNAGEPELTSRDCTTPSRNPISVLRCERDQPSALLGKVGEVDGAIGYVEVSAVSGDPGVTAVAIDGIAASTQAVAAGYKFWAPEFFYTYRKPADGTLLDSFLAFMDSPQAKKILRDAGYEQCAATAPEPC